MNNLECPSFIRGKKTRRFVEGLLRQHEHDRAVVVTLRQTIAARDREIKRLGGYKPPEFKAEEVNLNPAQGIQSSGFDVKETK